MKEHTTNYTDTIILVADDCPVQKGEVPALKADRLTIAGLQFTIIKEHPYRFTSDDVLFRVYAERNGIDPDEYEAARKQFFSKGQACFRASPLPKRYGWGIHSDAKGRIAMYGRETKEYRELIDNPGVKKVKAMRSSRA